MLLRSSFQLVLLCYFFLAAVTTGFTAENIFGSDGNDSLFGTSGGDEIVGGNGNDILTGNDGDDVLRGGNGDDVLRGGNGDDVLRGGNGDDILYGGLGIDRLYGGPGADQFVFAIDEMGADEVMDFNPEQNDIVLLQSKYTDMDTSTTTDEITGERVRIDDEGSVEVQSQNGEWVRTVRLNQPNLKINSRETIGGLQLFFTREF
jgi:Ca2+-binding RTX toxin-like protein